MRIVNSYMFPANFFKKFDKLAIIRYPAYLKSEISIPQIIRKCNSKVKVQLKFLLEKIKIFQKSGICPANPQKFEFRVTDVNFFKFPASTAPPRCMVLIFWVRFQRYASKWKMCGNFRKFLEKF